MTTDEDDDKLRICHACVGDPYLKLEIEKTGKPGECDYCGQVNPGLLIEELADRVERAFGDHYERTPDQPTSWERSLLSDPEDNFSWVRDGQRTVEAIEDGAGIPAEAASDVAEILCTRHERVEAAAMGEETAFADDAHYTERQASALAWAAEWRRFEQSLKSEARFFSRAATELLTRVFGDVDKLKTRARHAPVVVAGPGRRLSHLYRARVFQSTELLEKALGRPDRELGSPPSRFASAGRMNARGISVFYGATSARVALAEVRPPVGSHVAVAKFNITREVSLLDLTALGDVRDSGSIFDPTLKDRLERVAFLRTLQQRMTRPVMPNDEDLDYLATQAIADFLATENKPRLDGIIFPSVQSKGGRNVVLFHSAARVDEMPLPAGTVIETDIGRNTEDEECSEFHVREIIPITPVAECDDSSPFVGGPASQAHGFDLREPSLRVEENSVVVHLVTGVRVLSKKTSVSRNRRTARASRQ